MPLEEAVISGVRGREILRSSPLRSSKKVGAPKESRGRLDQPLPWIAAPSGLPTLAPGGRTGVGLSTARSGAGESEAVDPRTAPEQDEAARERFSGDRNRRRGAVVGGIRIGRRPFGTRAYGQRGVISRAAGDLRRHPHPRRPPWREGAELAEKSVRAHGRKLASLALHAQVHFTLDDRIQLRRAGAVVGGIAGERHQLPWGSVQHVGRLHDQQVGLRQRRRVRRRCRSPAKRQQADEPDGGEDCPGHRGSLCQPPWKFVWIVSCIMFGKVLLTVVHPLSVLLLLSKSDSVRWAQGGSCLRCFWMQSILCSAR